MHKRNIPVGAVLGVGLLGALIALGQDSRPPRPRAITPPPASDVELPLDDVPAPAKLIETKKLEITEAEPLPIVAPSTNPIQPVQHIESKTAPPKVSPPDVKDLFPPLPTMPPAIVKAPKLGKEKLTGPLPPAPPSNDLLPPPIAFPPVIGPAPPTESQSAPPKPWSPTDTPSAPKEFKVPEPPRPPVHSTIEMAPPRPAALPVSNPTTTPQDGPSRFVVPPKAPTPRPLPSAEPAGPANAEAPPAHGIRRLQPVHRPVVVNKAPGPLPKMTEIVQPTAPNLPVPAQDPAPGVLTPQLTVEKRGPLLHKVGGPMQYQIVLKNVGAIAAQQVRIEDEVPGAQVITTIPGVTQQTGDRLVWILPTLRPGEERTFMEDMQPVRPGDVVSTTSVHVYASTSFRTKLDGDIPAPLMAPPLNPAPLIGPSLVTPPASPPAASLPAPTGPSLLPNPSPPPALTPQVLPSPAPLPALPTSNSSALNAPPKQSPAPQAPAGPMPMTVDVRALQFVKLGQEMIFEVIVSNKGTTPLTEMWLYGKIPNGFRHPEGDNIGAPLPTLAPGETKSYKMPLTAVRPGRYVAEIRVTANPNYELIAQPVVTVEASGSTIKQSANPALPMGKENEINQVENYSTLQVQVQGKDDPLEQGKATIYQVRIKNMGSSPATNVRASLALSSGLKAGPYVQSPVAYELRGNDVAFQPIANIAAGQTKTIFVEVHGVAEGQQSVRAQVVSDQLRTPISREERTQVYRAR